MKKSYLACALALVAGMQTADAALTNYNVTTTWYEPQTYPNNSIFEGSFVYDSDTHIVSGLQGLLSESMTGMTPEEMVWLPLNYQLESWYDTTLNGTFAAVFKNNNTETFWSAGGTNDGWSPATGVAVGGVYSGFPTAANNPGNAYALIFVPTNPLAVLSQAQIDKLAYADCTPTAPGGMMAGGGMMGSVCMTGTAVAGYGAVGTMDGYPVSQTISAPAVPVPPAFVLLASGLGMLGAIARRRKAA